MAFNRNNTIRKDKNNRIDHIVINVFPIVLATILIWRGLWNLIDTMVPMKTKYDVISLLFGLLIIYRYNAFDRLA